MVAAPVLILGAPGDPQVVRVAEAVRAAGGRAVHCDAVAFPEKTSLSFENGALRLGRRVLPAPRSAYLRSLAVHPLSPGFADELSSRPRGLIAQCDEKRALLESVLLTLQGRGVRLVNSLEANEQHSRKPYQLELLRARGLPIPRWLATNDPAAVRSFVRRVGRAVYKPLAGGATVREVLPEDLAEDRLDTLAVAPVLFQEFVEGVAVRAYVVGRRVVAAAEIRSSELDYRRAEEAVVPTVLRPDERRAVLTAARACSMPFSGVDLIRSGRTFRLLECNPSPMFAAFEKKTGRDVAGPLAALLLGG